MHDGSEDDRGEAEGRSALLRILARLEDAGVFISGTMLAAAMVIIVTDVLMRYLFNSPLRWSYDLMSLFMIPAIFFLALSQTLRVRGHVSVDFFSHLMPPTFGRKVYAAGMLMGFCAVTAMVYALGIDAYGSASAGETAFGFYVWPIWIAKIIAFIGIAVLSLRALAILVDAIASRAEER